jgi:putative addiction module component (TIGR02574 family)
MKVGSAKLDAVLEGERGTPRAFLGVVAPTPCILLHRALATPRTATTIAVVSTVQEIARAAKKLPANKRLKLAEEIWFSGVDDALKVSTEHCQTLDERWTAYRSGKTARISRAELTRRLEIR